MKILFSPVRMDDQLSLTKSGDALFVNGEKFDFSNIPDGGLLPKEAIISDKLIYDVERINGEIEFTIILPISSAATEAQRFPEPIIQVTDGEIILP